MRSSLGSAFFTSVAIHLGALIALSLAWGWLRPFSPPSHLNGTDWIMVAPVPHPVVPVEPEYSAPPLPAIEEEVATVPPSPPLTSEPIVPPEPEAITPPKIVGNTAPKRVEPRPKPQLSPKPARVKKPPPDLTNEAAPGLREAPTGDGGAKTGPRLALPNETVETAAGNALGPSATSKAEEQPPGPVEGGEAGSGHLFDTGDARVIPGAGVEGGSGARGRGGLGLADEGRGARRGGVRPGSGCEGSDEGGGSTSLPKAGYQVKPRYPDSARRQGIEGTVLVKAYVTEQGRVDWVQVEQSAGHSDLDQAAVKAIGRWRFEPVRRGRQPVAMWVSIPVQFTLSR